MRMRRTAAALIALLAIACTDGPPHGGKVSPSVRSRDVSSANVLPALVLTADLTEPPARWHPVTTIPFGRGATTLGMRPQSRRHPGPVFPISFAVAPDRSLWFLDALKHRLAHFSETGAYIGQIKGVPFDPYHPTPRDLALDGSTPILLQTGEGLRGIVGMPAGGARITGTRIRDSESAVYVSRMIQGVEGVVAQLDGRAIGPGVPFDPDPSFVADLDVPGSGGFHRLPGLPLGDGTWIEPRFSGRLGSSPPASFRVTFSGRETTSVLPVHVRLVVGHTRLPAIASGEFDVALEHGIACIVSAGPDRFADRHSGDGRWFLALFDDGSPLVWERLPKPHIEDTNVVRHLAAGPGDSVYLMQVNAHEVSIYRR